MERHIYLEDIKKWTYQSDGNVYFDWGIVMWFCKHWSKKKKNIGLYFEDFSSAKIGFTIIKTNK